MDQRPQHKHRYIKHNKRVNGDSLEYVVTGDDFLNRTLIEQALIKRLDFRKTIPHLRAN